jgi:hypothetical protein
MRFQSLCSLTAAGLVAGVLACGEIAFPALTGEEFEATAAGTNEVPVVTTAATASAVFALLNDTTLSFRVDVSTIDSTTLSHIHQGAAGVNGAVLVDLFLGPTIAPTGCTAAQVASPRCRVGYSGILAQGQVKPSQLTKASIAGFGTTPRERFDSLLVLLRTGGVYLNVHNRLNPGGHVRGQTQPRP